MIVTHFPDLLQTCRINDHLVQLAHSANKLQHSRTAVNVNIVDASVDIHRNDVLAVFGGLERGVD